MLWLVHLDRRIDVVLNELSRGLQTGLHVLEIELPFVQSEGTDDLDEGQYSSALGLYHYVDEDRHKVICLNSVVNLLVARSQCRIQMLVVLELFTYPRVDIHEQLQKHERIFYLGESFHDLDLLCEHELRPFLLARRL